MDIDRSDRIHIRDLEVAAEIGVYPEERGIRQDLILNLTIFSDQRRASRDDDLESTVDYEAAAEEVVDLVESSSFRLIESLAAAVADRLLDHRGVRAVGVTVDKPGAVRRTRSVAGDFQGALAAAGCSGGGLFGGRGPRRSAEHPAGRFDSLAAAPAGSAFPSGFPDTPVESLEIVIIRGLPGRLPPGMVGNEVHLGFQAVHPFDEPIGVDLPVVHTGDQDVLDVQGVLVLRLRSIDEGRLEPFQGPDSIHRHQTLPKGVVRRIQADGEVEAAPSLLGLFPVQSGESLDSLDVADGGQGNPAFRDVRSPRIRQDVDGVQNRIEIVERLAHPHEDQVPHRKTQDMTNDGPLDDDLGGREIADQAHPGRLAEGASPGAAELAGNAECVPIVHGYHDGFRAIAVGRRQRELPGTSVVLPGDDRRQLHPEVLGNSLRQSGSGTEFIQGTDVGRAGGIEVPKERIGMEGPFSVAASQLVDQAVSGPPEHVVYHGSNVNATGGRLARWRRA